MPPRAPGTGAVPEVDRERAVRKIEVKDSAGREHADEAFQESGALRVPGGKWRNLVEAGSTALGHADVLDDSRRDYGVEEAVEEGKAQRVRDDEPLAVCSGPPLPLAKCREVVSPRFEARLREEVDRLAVPAARVEDAPRARRAQDRQVVILDAAPRAFVLESATSLLGQGLGVGVVDEVPPLGEVRDTVVDWELLAAHHADQRARRPAERAAACRTHQAGNALAGPLFHSQKSLPGACPGRAALSSDLPAPLLQSPRGERGSVRRADPARAAAARGVEELRGQPRARPRGREARRQAPEGLPRDLREPHAMAEDPRRAAPEPAVQD